MQQKTMVREYPNQAASTTDEQKLGLQGWSVAATVRPDPKPGMLARLRTRVTRPPAPTGIVVTYTRGQPSSSDVPLMVGDYHQYTARCRGGAGRSA